MSKSFHIEYSKELVDSIILCDIIKKDGWINRNTVIVNCAPLYSSRITQLINHKLSHLNGNELFECINVEMPSPNMSQIYDPFSHDYEFYDRYVANWIKDHIDSSMQYLFLSCSTLRGKNFSKLRTLAKSKLENDQMRFGCIYLQSDSIFIPDYYTEKFDKEKQGSLLFQWENINNPNK